MMDPAAEAAAEIETARAEYKAEETRAANRCRVFIERAAVQLEREIAAAQARYEEAMRGALLEWDIERRRAFRVFDQVRRRVEG